MQCCAIRCLAKFGILLSRTNGADGKLRFHYINPVTLIDGSRIYANTHYFATGNVRIGNRKVSRAMHLLRSTREVKATDGTKLCK